MDRRRLKDAQIIKIIPAQPGWEVVWAYDPESVSDAEYYTESVVCWALVELGNRSFVTALIARGDDSELALAYDGIEFLGYAHPGLPSTAPYWKEEATSTRESLKVIRAEKIKAKSNKNKQKQQGNV